ncbi:MAG: ABC transporter ATP-binding protein [Gaiellales bacterium]
MSSDAGAMREGLLEVRHLSVTFRSPDGPVSAVSDLSLTVVRGETMGLVGESGSGKSATCLALAGLLDRDTATVEGQAIYHGRDLVGAAARQLRRVRGRGIGFVFQDPFASLHPMFTVGDQIVEAIRAHDPVGKRAARDRAVELMGEVGIPRPRARFGDYPHQYSGGMRQRALIAIALAHGPDILIADEPTTALDVTVQAQILELIDRLKREIDMAVILVTHDLGVVAEHADRIVVMYAGRAIEAGRASDVLQRPGHPYTWGLLDSMPDLDAPRGRLAQIDGQPPSLLGVPPGCAFQPRCPHAVDRCTSTRPALETQTADHATACLLDPAWRRELWQARQLAKEGSPA